ncbi:MAG TPA: hypothetical protein VII33_05920 [Nakamurella sp.]
MAEQVVRSDDELVARGIPCSFCSTEIPAVAFDEAYWSATKRLLSAACPGCHQRTVLSLKVWRRWSGMNMPGGP